MLGRKAVSAAIGWTIVALICGACGGGSAPAAPPRTGGEVAAAPEASETPTVRTPDDPMALLPLDCQIAIHVDGAVLRETPEMGRILGALRTRNAEVDARMAEYFVERTDALVLGIDLVTEPRRARVVAVVRGRYERLRVLEAFGGTSMADVERDERDLWVLDRADDVVTRLVDDRTLVATHPGLWPSVAALLDGGEGTSLRRQSNFLALADLAEIGDHAVSAVAVMTDPLQERLTAETERDLAMAALSGMLSTIRGGVLKVDVAGGATLEAIVETGSAGQANALVSLARLLQGTVANAVEDPIARELIRRAQVTRRDAQLRVNTRLEQVELDGLIETLTSPPPVAAAAAPSQERE